MQYGANMVSIDTKKGMKVDIKQTKLNTGGTYCNNVEIFHQVISPKNGEM